MHLVADQPVPEGYRQCARVVFAGYPAKRYTQQEIDDYAAHLNGFPLSMLARVSTRVTEFFGLFAPNADQLKQLAKRIDREQREEKSEEAPYMGEPAHLAPDNPYEQLAREFERRIAAGTFDPKVAATELSAVMEGKPIAFGIDGERMDWKLRAAGGEVEF